jgi:hypothetical protein
MFGEEAPVWPFLTRFGGPADPLGPVAETWVLETYPVLTIIALSWTLPDSRASGRLPKYNPQRKKTFSISDWRHICELASAAFRERGLMNVARWVNDAAQNTSPRKSDQDGLDACLCLLVALYLAEGKDCLMVGDQQTGYIVVPYGAGICAELNGRCNRTGRVPSEWVRAFRLRAVRRDRLPFLVRTTESWRIRKLSPGLRRIGESMGLLAAISTSGMPTICAGLNRPWLRVPNLPFGRSLVQSL